MDAMRRRAGRPSSSNPGQLDPNNQRSNLTVAESVGESVKQLQRFIRLMELIQDLLSMVDSGTFPFNTGVELSYLKREEQQMMLAVMTSTGMKPTMAQSTRLKELSQSDVLTEEMIVSTFVSEKAEPDKVSIPTVKLRKYFPATYTVQKMNEIIISLLEDWAKANHPLK